MHVGDLTTQPAVKDRWGKTQTVVEASYPDQTDPAFTRRVRIVRSSFKYPLLRIEEVLRHDSGSGANILINQNTMVADHVLVTPAGGSDATAFRDALKSAGYSVRATKSAPAIYLVTFPEPLSLGRLSQAIDTLKSLTGAGAVAIAEPDFLVYASATPNDPYYPEMYNLHNTGESGGVADADIDAPEAWEITTGSRSIRVGVIDTGINYNHPDLAANIWTNPREIAGNGIDDDNNGFIDDVRGWDFANNDADPNDDDGHGTHCAGVIGALGNNELGIVGVNWEVSLVPIKFLNSEGEGVTSDAVSSVNYATALGLDLTSNSWGGGTNSQTLSNAIAQAGAANRLFIAGAGNDGRNNNSRPFYPSSFNLDNIVAVAASDRTDTLATFSNYGSTSVDLAAPGVDIRSTVYSNSYELRSGTSMATPHVAGAAALVLANNGPLTAAKLKSILLGNVDPIASMAGRTVTGGRLNVAAAVMGRNRTLHHFVCDPVPSSLVRGAPVTIRVRAIAADGLPAGGFNSPVTLGAAGTTLAAPVVATGWVGGVWTGQVTPVSFSASASFTIPPTGIAPGISSSSFSVGTGPLARFTWDNVAGSQITNTPFPVALRATDAGGNPVLYSGLVALSALLPRTLAQIGPDSGSDSYPFASSSGGAGRQQVIYPASELGATPRRLTALALRVNSSSPTALFRNWTIRLKNSPKTALSNPVFDSEGWTTVHVSDATPAIYGWHTFVFSTPFDYDGQSSLFVDFSYTSSVADSNYFSTNSTYKYPVIRSIVKSGAAITNPALFTIGNISYFAPVLRFSDLETVSLRPASAALVNGIWNGSVSLPNASDATQLRATSSAPAAVGYSNIFTVLPPAPPPLALPINEPMDSSPLPYAWSLAGDGSNKPYITSASLPRSGTGHLIFASSNSTAVLTNATLTLDLSSRTGVTLSFWAKGFNETAHAPSVNPFSGPENFDGVAISGNGVNWYEVQPLRAPALTNEWTQFTVNLDAAIAASGMSYTPSFRIRFNRYGANSPPIGGIAVDDVSVYANPLITAQLSLPSAVAESASPVNGILSLPSSRPDTVVFNLISSAPAKISVPSTVTLPAGQTTVSFVATPLNDELFDGGNSVTISAIPPGGSGLQRADRNIIISDDEAPSGSLVVAPDTLAENSSSSATATLTLLRSPAAPVSFALAASDDTAVTMPPSVIMNRGQTTATFSISPVDNTQVTGTRNLSVSATMLGMAPLTAPITMTDDEASTLRMYNDTIFEGTTKTGNIILTGTLTAPMTVYLSSSNPARLSVPETIVIPAGVTYATFTFSALDNDLVENKLDVQITATASGFTQGTATISISDNDADSLIFYPISASQIAGRPFLITVRAVNKDGVVIPNYNKLVSITARGSSGPLPLSISTMTFASGYSQATLSVKAQDTTCILALEDAMGRTGTSNSFTLGVGSVNLFSISAANSEKLASGIPYPVTIRAEDAFGNTITSYNDTVDLSVGPAPLVSGTGTSYTVHPLPASGAKLGRTQAIYSPQEAGPAGTLKSLALYISAPAGLQLQNWIIRVKHFNLIQTLIWGTSDWTTVYNGSVDLSPNSEGWVEFPFLTPFNYDGVNNLMVDLSFNNNTAFTSAIQHGARSTPASTRRVIYAYAANDSYGPAATWLGITAPAVSGDYSTPNIRLSRAAPTTVSPTATGAFSGGVWTGAITLNSISDTPVTLQARRNSLFGQSSPFTVVAPLPDFDSDGLPDDWEITHNLNAASQSTDNGTLGDPDRDGLPNFLEYAFGLDPQSGETQSPTTTAILPHPQSGQSHLVFAYRRLLQPGTLNYKILTSTDLATWTAPSSAPETLSTVANPDGLTETVTVRLNPALSGGGLFVRLKVSNP